MSGLSMSQGNDRISNIIDPAVSLSLFSFSEAIRKKGDAAAVQCQKFNGPKKESCRASVKAVTDLALKGLSQLSRPGTTFADLQACTRNYDEALKGILRSEPINREQAKCSSTCVAKAITCAKPSFSAPSKKPVSPSPSGPTTMQNSEQRATKPVPAPKPNGQPEKTLWQRCLDSAQVVADFPAGPTFLVSDLISKNNKNEGVVDDNVRKQN